jgi:hypothetical protein
MKRIAAMATFKGREHNLQAVIDSIKDQVDELHIYNNSEEENDYTTNAKFYFLQFHKEPVYYLTIDDDIIYPPTYVQDMVNAIERTGTIVTHHGREFLGVNRNYYYGHNTHVFSKVNTQEKRIDTAGTGVTAFRTDYFNPVEMYKSIYPRMADVLFGWLAIKDNKIITLLKHEAGYFVPLPNDPIMTVHGTQSKTRQEFQIMFANKIYKKRWKLS